MHFEKSLALICLKVFKLHHYFGILRGTEAFFFPIWKVCELATVKRPQERSYMLQRWQDEGGVMIIGYEMYRNLAQGRNVKSRKLKEIFNKALVDPGKWEINEGMHYK